jgi:hypothetical protein
MGELLKPIADISKTGWKLNTTDFQGIESQLETSILKSVHPKLGVEISYGQGPDGYDQWVIKEVNGGGSVIIPYLYINGELYVGANRQKRSLTGGLVTEVPRGFSLPHETHLETAKREFQEEAGVIRPLAERVKSLSGKPINPNSTYFQANPRKCEGVKLFGVKIEANEVELRRGSKNPKKKSISLHPDCREKLKN